VPLPFFVSFEGGEGSGKSTQARLLYQHLREQQVNVILVREPGSTRLGDRLREFVLSQGVSPQAELLLFLAARAQLVREVVLPALKRGVSVVADRFADSSVAYQGYGRRLGAQAVHQLNQFATGGIAPHLTVLLDIPPEEGLARLVPPRPLGLEEPAPSGRAGSESREKFEAEALAFHRRVRQGYLALARAEPSRWLVLDARLPQDQLTARIWERVQPLLAGPG
jgi:dTMP kinase